MPSALPAEWVMERPGPAPAPSASLTHRNWPRCCGRQVAIVHWTKDEFYFTCLSCAKTGFRESFDRHHPLLEELLSQGRLQLRWRR